MKYTLRRKLDRSALARFFEKAWSAEVSSDVESNYALFQKVWENIDEDPAFEEYDDFERASLFRYCGYFLSHYGQAKNIPLYQERGKNLLTRAIDLFYLLDLPEKALEAEICLGLCYFYEGAIAESEAVYRHILDEFQSDQLHPLCLRAKLNSTMLLQWKGEYQKAVKIIEEIEVPMEFCRDPRILTIYHHQVGLIYRGINRYDRAVYHYNKCIEISQQENNRLVVGKTHNNLAFLYKETGDYASAHYHIEEAIRIFRKLNHAGFLPLVFDTKAVILLEEGKFEAALETISKAVAAFQKSDDYAGLVDALWNKSKSLLGLNRKPEAIETFAELCRIAQLRIGDYAVKRYSRLFAEIVYTKQSGSLKEEVRRFKKYEVSSALRRSKHDLAKASKLLGFSDAEKLKILIENEFPSIYEELGIKQTRIKPEIKRVQKDESAETKPPNPKQINRIEFQNAAISFSAENDLNVEREIKTFYVAAEISANLFDLAEDIVIATAPIDKPAAGRYILVQRLDTREYIFSRILHDESLDIFYLLNGDEPFPLEEVGVIGTAVGYRLFQETDDENLVFQPLPVA